MVDHLDVALRAVAGTLTNRIEIATTQVPSVEALPLPVGLHARAGACTSATAPSSCRSVIARALKKLPMIDTPVH